MRLVWLSWYIGGVQALAAVGLSAITWAPPGPGPLQRAMPAGFGSGAVAWFLLGVVLGFLPRDNWVHRSRAVWWSLLAGAAALTVLLAVFAG